MKLFFRSPHYKKTGTTLFNFVMTQIYNIMNIRIEKPQNLTEL